MKNRKIFSALFLASPALFIAAAVVNSYFTVTTIVLAVLCLAINTMLLSDHTQKERKVKTKSGDETVIPAGNPEDRFNGTYRHIGFTTILFLLVAPLIVSAIPFDENQQKFVGYSFIISFAVLFASWSATLVIEGVLRASIWWWNRESVKLVREDFFAKA